MMDGFSLSHPVPIPLLSFSERSDGTEEVRRGNHSLLSSHHFLTVFPSREGEGEG